MDKQLKFDIERDLGRILSGEFDKNIVRSLLMYLREFRNGNDTFMEFADFTAHRLRDKGIIRKRLDYFVCWTKYFYEYEFSDKKKTLNLFVNFPKYILDLAKIVINNLPNEHFIILKESRNDINVLLNKRFKDIGNGLVSLDDKTVSLLAKDRKIVKRIKFIEGVLRIFLREKPFLIAATPCFTQQEIVASIIDVLNKNKIEFNESEFWKISDKLMLVILRELHRSEYQLSNNSRMICKIGGIELHKHENNGEIILKSSRLFLGATIEVGEKIFCAEYSIPVGFGDMLIETSLSASSVV